MKTKDLINLLLKNGWSFKRHGANHDIYTKGNERVDRQLQFSFDDRKRGLWFAVYK